MRIVILLLLFLTTACAETENKVQSKTYYDLAGMLTEQIGRLSAKKPQVEKSVAIKDKQEKIVTRDIDWNKELELFLQTDLNKQSYQSAYTVAVVGNKISYQRKTGEMMPVKHLLIVFDGKGSPQHIEAEIHAKNYLYESDKKLTADFENNQLRNYQITGYQQLFVGGKKNFSIEGKIKGDY